MTGFFSSKIYFFRAVPKFVAQFGIHGDPKVGWHALILTQLQVMAEWRSRPFPDDPSIGKSNIKGSISFASAGVCRDVSLLD